VVFAENRTSAIPVKPGGTLPFLVNGKGRVKRKDMAPLDRKWRQKCGRVGHFDLQSYRGERGRGDATAVQDGQAGLLSNRKSDRSRNCDERRARKKGAPEKNAAPNGHHILVQHQAAGPRLVGELI